MIVVPEGAVTNRSNQFVNHPQISAILLEEEEECLHYMTKLEVEEFEDIKSGFRIRLFFDENPYFENQVIEKELRLNSCSSVCTKIDWKSGSELAARVQAMMSSRGRKFTPRSFFSWLASESGDNDDIAEVIKDDMWPNPLQYFLVPDIEVENGQVEEEEEDDDEEEEGVVVLEDEEEVDEEEEFLGEEEDEEDE